MDTIAAPRSNPTESDLRFLEYRWDVIQNWPPSARKIATCQAITGRLTSIGRSALTRPEVDHLLTSTCQLLESLFTADSDNAA